MRWVQVGDVDLLECEGCDGTWIEADAFERLCLERERQSAIAQKPIASRAASDARHAERVQYRPCPQCGKLMNRQNFGRLSGTVVDTCGRHGTFLDRGELHQVVRFILDGGFERMRRAKAEQLLEQLREEQRRLRDLEIHLSRRRHL